MLSTARPTRCLTRVKFREVSRANDCVFKTFPPVRLPVLFRLPLRAFRISVRSLIMGWLSATCVQAALATVLLGALKRAGIVSVHPNVIEDENVRTIFVGAVELGEAVMKKIDKVVKHVRMDT